MSKIEVSSPTVRRRAGLKFGPVPVILTVKDLTEDQLKAIDADPRLKIKLIEGPTDPDDEDERLDLIREAANGLSGDDLTQDGTPKVSALADALGWKPSKAEITKALSAG